MNVDSAKTCDERLIVLLNPPSNPRGGERPSHCLWLGKDAEGQITAGHGLMLRKRLNNPDIKKHSCGRPQVIPLSSSNRPSCACSIVLSNERSAATCGP